MRSKELADFAGVTVRTLRHYHTLGLLPEPPRGSNGYREYRMADAARVLRIKHMASVGFSLQRIKEVFDAEAAGTASAADDFSSALDALDAELVAEIARLEERRRTIARLRAEGADPDVPAEFGAHMARIRKGGASLRHLEAERASLLFAGAAAEAGELAHEDVEAVRKFLDLIGESEAMSEYLRINDAILAMPSDASEEERQRAADEFSAWFVPLIKRGAREHDWKIDSADLADCRAVLAAREKGLGEAAEAAEVLGVFDEYDRETLSEAQQDVALRILEAIVEGICQQGLGIGMPLRNRIPSK